MPEITQEQLDAFKKGQEDFDALKKSNEESDSTQKRLEGENTKLKTRAQDAELKLTDLEKQKLEDDGDIQKRLEVEIEENTKLKAENLKSKEDKITSKVKNGILELFPNLQKGSVDLILQIKEHKKLLKIDNETGTVEGIKEFGEAVEKSHPYFFTKQSLNTGTKKNPDNKDDLDDEGLTDNQKYAKELKIAAGKDQAALDAVRKKYGRL